MSKKHLMHVENHPCDCGANNCHEHTRHHVICSCGFRDFTVSYDNVKDIVLQHSPDFETYRKGIASTRYPR